MMVFLGAMYLYLVTSIGNHTLRDARMMRLQRVDAM